jgi:Na+-transporting methylmalonyl-CoA/oxaloacetate decarboxylase gamma subunit
MSLLRFILLFILFYVIYRMIKLFIRYFRLGARSNNNFQKGSKSKSKYENVEEAEFTEIKTKEKTEKK